MGAKPFTIPSDACKLKKIAVGTRTLAVKKPDFGDFKKVKGGIKKSKRRLNRIEKKSIFPLEKFKNDAGVVQW
jgi:hypothetical protein